MMYRGRLKIVALGCAALATLVQGEIIDWKDTSGTTVCFSDVCRAEGAWNKPKSWTNNDIPDTTIEAARFNRQNDFSECNADGSERWLEMTLITDTIASVRVETESGGTGRLSIAFVGNYNLTLTGIFVLDGTNGPVTVEMAESAKIQTN